MKDLHSSSSTYGEECDKASEEEVVFNLVSSLSTTATAETSIPTKPLHHIRERPVLAGLLPPASSSLAGASSDNDDEDDTESAPDEVTVLYGIRHGLSVSNEWMRRDGNVWGSPTYNDEHNIPDAPLSETGIQQARELRQQIQSQQPQELSNGSTRTTRCWLDKVQLIVVSPLTRCLQTYQHALEPIEILREIPVLALPLLTERVYSISETGRPVSQLQVEFPHIDWSEFDTLPWENVKDCWWYDPTIASPFVVPATNAASVKQQRNDVGTDEWRPTGQGQRYLAVGEPKLVFERRMAALHQWLVNRPERYILAVSHWGVLRHFTDGQELDNCQVCTMKLLRKG